MKASPKTGSKTKKTDRPKVVRIPRPKASENDIPVPSIESLEVEPSLFQVGHHPNEGTPVDPQALIESFQSNLLSLISHELRTPMSSVLNGVRLIEDEVNTSGDLSRVKDLLGISIRNAEKLNSAINAILDVSAIESQSLHLRLSEVNWPVFIRARVSKIRDILGDQQLELVFLDHRTGAGNSTFLGDINRLDRVLELALGWVGRFAKPGGKVEFTLGRQGFQLDFLVSEGAEKDLEGEWNEAQIAVQSGLAQGGSAFSQTLRSEKEFLSRTREGLGVESLLLHHLVRLHVGEMALSVEGSRIHLKVNWPELPRQEQMESFLDSKLQAIRQSHLQSVALVLFQPTGHKPTDPKPMTQGLLQRLGDGVYSLQWRGEFTWCFILEQCSIELAHQWVRQIQKSLEIPGVWTAASAPDDGMDQKALLDVAASRIKSFLL